MPALVFYPGLRLSDNIEDYPEGIIVPVDKPYRWTSADVIRKVKWAAVKHFSKRNLKVGHAGTLDPLATGMLLVCIGKATKLAQELQSHEKEYIAGVTFGATTPSYDREKEIDCMFPVDGVSRSSLEAVLPSFLGDQEQVAPLFSAKSVDGVRAYELARKAYRAAMENGTPFDHADEGLLTRQHISISRLEVLSYRQGGPDGKPCGCRTDGESGASCSEEALRPNPRIHVNDMSGLDLPSAEILVGCSKGTYIRALARDLGEALGSGAFLHSLRRTRIGEVTACVSLADVLSGL